MPNRDYGSALEVLSLAGSAPFNCCLAKKKQGGKQTERQAGNTPPWTGIDSSHSAATLLSCVRAELSDENIEHFVSVVGDSYRISIERECTLSWTVICLIKYSFNGCTMK